MRDNFSLYKRLDWVLIILYLALVFIGWVNILASCGAGEDGTYNILDFGEKYGKQLIWICASLVLAVIIIFVINPKLYNVFAWWIYGIMMLVLVAVIFVGVDINGSRSWIRIGPLQIQPAEFAKIATIIALSSLMSKYGFTLKKKIHFVEAVALIILPILLILMEKEAGSALVFFGLIFMLYREGMSGWILVIGGTVVLFFILTLLWGPIITSIVLLGTLVVAFLIHNHYTSPHSKLKRKHLLIKYYILALIMGIGMLFSVGFVFDNVLQPHQKARIEDLLGIKEDIMGVGYNVHQSKIAIGSGGLFGKGFLQGTQTKYDFVPEQSTDFIFCTVGEEWGFVGSLLVIILYASLIIRIINRAEKSENRFTRIYGYSIACIFAMHVFINIGMTIGLVPVIGIPLPFFSYGGSSLWCFTIMLFIFIRLDLEKEKWR